MKCTIVFVAIISMCSVSWSYPMAMDNSKLMVERFTGGGRDFANMRNNFYDTSGHVALQRNLDSIGGGYLLKRSLGSGNGNGNGSGSANKGGDSIERNSIKRLIVEPIDGEYFIIDSVKEGSLMS